MVCSVPLMLASSKPEIAATTCCSPGTVNLREGVRHWVRPPLARRASLASKGGDKVAGAGPALPNDLGEENEGANMPDTSSDDSREWWGHLMLDFQNHNIVFDRSRCREGTADLMALIPRIRATWERKGITMEMHYSKPCPGAITPCDRRKHRPRVSSLPPCPPDVGLDDRGGGGKGRRQKSENHARAGVMNEGENIHSLPGRL
ncbi:hypothetical protein MAPG_01682 [Magnaporthiopsis poae ATCC 64411]|uniref:Uncharacterized protein n=1 Tax=Magnaporthiopsis poae (strain ATCC 64411 / 73-15) TaxID=644358 RepID=A0A0C4DPC1_MAGP6|nr:hypothetical protein MAPG_01682 [Magnaporthiopsis poae ATCC 64411]